MENTDSGKIRTEANTLQTEETEKNEPKINKRVAKAAFKTSIPIMAGYLVLGLGFGVMLRDAGYGAVWALAMSAGIYSGSIQFVGVGLISSGASIITTALTSLAVSARFFFISISMLPNYSKKKGFKTYLIYALTDETYSVLCEEESYPENVDHGAYAFLVSLFDEIYWVAGSLAGDLIGANLPFSTEGIDFTMTALFISIYVDQWMKTKQHIPAIAGIVISVAARLIFGPDYFLIPALITIIIFLSLMKKKVGGEQYE